MRVTGHLREKNTKRGKSYQIVIEFPTQTGKRNRKFKTVYCTKKKAQKILNDMIYEYEHGTYVEPSKTTIEKFLKEWMETYVIPNKSPTTYENYQKIINRYICPILGNYTLEDLTPIMVQKWVNSLANGDYIDARKPLKPQTVKNIFLILHSSMEKAIELKLITESPCTYTTLPKLVKYNAQIFDEEELQKFLTALKGTELETPLLIILSCGLRRGEALALKWSSIDWQNKKIHITESIVQTPSKKILTKEPKSKAGIRSIVMPNQLYEYLKLEYERRKLLDKHFSEDDYIIHAKSSKQPCKPDSLSKKFKCFLKRNNLKDIRLHDLRHECASLLLKSGVNPRVAKDILGHSTVSITLDTYSHVLKSVENDAAEKLNQQLFGNKK